LNSDKRDWQLLSQKSETCHITSSQNHITSHVRKMSASSTNASAYKPDITFKNGVTQSGPLAVDASFQFVDVRDMVQ